jgi:hypothetical protein
VAQYCEMKRTKDPKLVDEVHCLSAGLKAYTTHLTAEALSTCRECCGGHGYAAVSVFSKLLDGLSDSHILHDSGKARAHHATGCFR